MLSQGRLPSLLPPPATEQRTAICIWPHSLLLSAHLRTPRGPALGKGHLQIQGTSTMSSKCGLFLPYSKASKTNFFPSWLHALHALPLSPTKCCFFLMPALETREDTGQIHLLCMLLQKSMTSPLTLHPKYIKLIWRKKDNYCYKLKGDKLSAYLTERRACERAGVTGVLRVGTPRRVHHTPWGRCHEPRAVPQGPTVPAHT